MTLWSLCIIRCDCFCCCCCSCYYYNSQLWGNRGVARHGFGREVVVAVWAVQEGLSPLVVSGLGEVGVKYEPRARGGLRIQWTASCRRPVLHVETAAANKSKQSPWVAQFTNIHTTTIQGHWKYDSLFTCMHFNPFRQSLKNTESAKMQSFFSRPFDFLHAFIYPNPITGTIQYRVSWTHVRSLISTFW